MTSRESGVDTGPARGARVIELFGPPGVGKTCVFSALVARRRDGGGRWKTAVEAVRRERAVPLGRPGRAVAYCLARHKFLERIVYRPPTKGERRDALLAMASNWAPFMEACLESSPNDARSAEQRLLGLQWLSEALQVRALLELGQARSLVVADEALSHKSFSVLSEAAKDRVKEQRYFETMPLPTALVHFRASAGIIVQRLRQREEETEKVIPRHRRATDRQLRSNTEWALEISHRGARLLENRGTRVLWLDAEQLPKESVQRIESFMRSVHVPSAYCNERSSREDTSGQPGN